MYGQYWLELPLVVGLWFRSVADAIAMGLMGDAMESGEQYAPIDTSQSTFDGFKLQRKPVAWNPAFPDAAYLLYGVSMAYWGFVFQIAFANTIANPGVVFGALGVPPLVMKAVAYANVFVLYYYAGSYLATYTKRRLNL